jgi:Zn-finger nucleic acid-binding protein
MREASLLLSCWESASRMREPWATLGLLEPLAEESEFASLASLSVGERDARLLALRRRLFGEPVEALAVCPQCGSTVELNFQVSNMEVKPPANAQLWVEHRGWRVDFRLPDSRDLAAVAACTSVEEARRRLIERCVVNVSRRSKPYPADDAPQHLIQLMEERMSEADPQADIRLKMTCPGCGGAWTAGLEIDAFVAKEVAAGARRLLQEVHRLARAYGWSEGEILGMAVSRRQAYLELVGTD